ncbi:anti-sigma factor [Sphingomonas mesophila]|uniref:anti-sigma factor n=1 Tax=Sphingomonas mesophila TaxID=2303576 RepID=UPI000E56FAD5|nr:anti-sigma factor [Sphingomonas mesophila]
MTADRLTPDDRSALAAELALGLLEGDELSDARALAARDAAFRAEVERWGARFAPLLDNVADKVPEPAIWQSIEAAIEPARGAANDDQPDLRRRLARWRMASGGLGALAAALALVLLTRPQPQAAPATAPAPQIAAATPMVAMLAGNDPAPVRLVANWDPAARQLIVTPAMTPPHDPARAMEVWVIPADGTPHSMGLMPAEGPMRGTIDPAMGRLLRSGATLAISIEQPGGSPTGAPQGPVVARGELIAA